jgi:hypothetical protein
MTDDKELAADVIDRKRLNGWQRLWLVGTACLGLWLTGWLPLQAAHRLMDWWPLLEAPPISSFDYRLGIEKDFRNPQCRAYQVSPISTLRRPPSEEGGSCWHIYTSRKSGAAGEVPYTLEVYDRDRDAWWWTVYFETLNAGICATILLSACGWIVGWIYRGFRRA